MASEAPIYVAGHTGLVGSAMCRLLEGRGHTPLTATRRELDLTDRPAVDAFFARHRPGQVYLLAGLVGGIAANAARPADFLWQNLAIQLNVMRSAVEHGTARLLFPGSACAYPKDCPQPITPEMLLSGAVEPTSLPFAVAKIAGLVLADAFNRQHGTRFVRVVPATTYGPNDHFTGDGHVISSMMARMHEAKLSGLESFAIWGTGTPRREFLYVDDLAEGLALLMDRYEGSEVVHVGAGSDVSIADLARLMARVIGYAGQILCDTSRPDGMPRRLLDSSGIFAMNWRPRVSLEDGLARTYAWFLAHAAKAAS